MLRILCSVEVVVSNCTFGENRPCIFHMTWLDTKIHAGAHISRTRFRTDTDTSSVNYHFQVENRLGRMDEFFHFNRQKCCIYSVASSVERYQCII